jgi:hypothetical protein
MTRLLSPLAALAYSLSEIYFGCLATDAPRVLMTARSDIGDAPHDGEHDTVARAECTRTGLAGTHMHLLC